MRRPRGRPAAHRAMMEAEPPLPRARRLRVFAFDPLLGTELDTVALNEAVISVRWERGLAPGPVGEYLEVIDVDPPSGLAYAPVDLDHPALLAEDGLAPSEGRPQFHQQMVYAVAMKTIAHFERALGRCAQWSARIDPRDGGARFVRRLRVHPHALREANAYYSPERKALLFGYFTGGGDGAAGTLPGGTIFTCLSHDIVAHETAHALLDGLHPRYCEPTNPDMLAFHEAFADIVALFQHFTMPEALRNEVARTRGDLATATLLAGLAAQFGTAIGARGALRSAIADVKPRPTDYTASEAPHRRGAVLVAAVFDAFIRIYRRETADLIRIATGGTGVLPPGAIAHDLAERLAQDAAKVAGRILAVCIRALDYCPPVDLTFGEYLRALITADCDLVPDDPRGYRTAFVAAFRARGILPPGVATLSVPALVWQGPDRDMDALRAAIRSLRVDWRLQSDRHDAFVASDAAARALERKLLAPAMPHAVLAALGLHRVTRAAPMTVAGVRGRVERPRVHSVRPSQRVGPDGQVLNDMIVEITQAWQPDDPSVARHEGGCTILCDRESGSVRYVVRKRTGHPDNVAAQRAYLERCRDASPQATYFNEACRSREPFALIHRGG